jgi:Ran GTPase-activating protein (RanGAP) involved in mRNA processing and transport
MKKNVLNERAPLSYEERLERNPTQLNNPIGTIVRNERYPDVKDTDYMDLAGQNLQCQGLMGILDHMYTDEQLKQIDISQNITLEEAYQPKRMARLCDKLCNVIKKNQCLTAIDLVGNHFGNFGPHPLNEQLRDICLDIAKALPKSNIKRIDISDNCLTGTSGRKLTALGYFSRHFIHTHGKYFLSRSNLLQSQALVMIANGMGHGSSIEYLDLNDNRVGLDPSGMRNSEGMYRFAAQAQHTLTLRVVKLARNSLTDDDVQLLCESLMNVPTLQVLDLAGNLCMGNGMMYVRDLILSHGVLNKNRGLGLRDLDISFNPIGDLGAKFIGEAIPRSFTLEALNISGCEIPTSAMYDFAKAMSKNGYIGRFKVALNACDELSEEHAVAEGLANADLVSIRVDPLSVDPTTYTRFRYNALRYKLHLLDEKSLKGLHKNPGFVIPLSGLREELFCLSPPGRRFHLNEIIDEKPHYQRRIDDSNVKDEKIQLTLKIYHCVLRWWRTVQEKNRIKEALLAKKRQMEEEEKKQLALQGLNMT